MTTELNPITHALHAMVWPLVARRAEERCETIEEENAFMNARVPELAPYLLETPLPVLSCLWGLHPDEALERCDGIRAALRAAALPDATKQTVEAAYRSKARY